MIGIFAASCTLGSSFLQQAINRSRNADDLLTRIARAALAAEDTETFQALDLAMQVEYIHPELIQAVLGSKLVPGGPWFQQLDEGWSRLRRTWRAPLGATLRAKGKLDDEVLQRISSYLISQGAIEQAVHLCLESGNYTSAAQIITGEAEKLMNLGRWETLNNWLSQIPASALQTWPWLVYTKGELAIVQGQTDNARQVLAEASALFLARKDSLGACQSLLAESTLSGWHDDQNHARACALAASAMAEAAGLMWEKGWAAWQLGCLSIAASQWDEALKYFNEAASAIKDPHVMELFQQVEMLALRQQEFQQQAEFHRLAYSSFELSEKETVERLRSLIYSPSEKLPALLNACGWFNTPLMAKLSPPQTSAEIPEAIERNTFFQRILAIMGMRKYQSQQITGVTESFHASALDIHLSAIATGSETHSITHPLPIPDKNPFIGEETKESLPDRVNPVLEEEILPGMEINPNPVPLALGERDELSEPGVKSSAKLILTVYLLGKFRFAINDIPFEKLPSNRAAAVFKYLLAHRAQETSREVLMDIFWPEANPEAARNNLNVALHNLRHSFRSVTDEPVVFYDQGSYRLNLAMQVWTDSDEYERHVLAGRQLEENGQVSAALNEYEIASSFYQGDFLADDPYEDWPVTTRERLRVMYLETLDHLSRIYFSQGQYTACAALCQRILERDDCREDAHCLLMRCYSRQGQHALALRQYRACVQELHKELDVEPEPATTQLAERIRRRERV